MRHFACSALLAFAVMCVNAQPAKAAPVLFKDSQFEVVHEYDVVYGKGAVEGGEMNLLFDLYKPQGANVPALKPAFIGVHGGGFVMGDKRGPPTNMAELARTWQHVAMLRFRSTIVLSRTSRLKVARSWNAHA